MKKVIILFISALVTLFLCLWLNTHEFSPKVEQELAEESFWINKAHQNKKFDAVILGDSRALRGINPKYLSKYEDVYNLAFRSASFTKDYLKYGQSILKNGGTFIIAITPHSFVSLDNPNEHLYEYKNQSFDEVLIKKNHFLHRLLSPFRDRKFNIRQKPKYDKIFFNNGFVATNLKDSNIGQGIEVYKNIFSKRKFDIELFENFLDLARRSGNNYVFFRMPSCLEMEELENSLSIFNENLVKKLVDQSGFKWIGFDNKFNFETYDASHLKPSSAKKFSIYLNKLL